MKFLRPDLNIKRKLMGPKMIQYQTLSDRNRYKPKAASIVEIKPMRPTIRYFQGFSCEYRNGFTCFKIVGLIILFFKQ